MDNMIKSIDFFAIDILSKKEVKTFSFQPIFGVNVFYCPNGYGKSSLFRILREVFRLEEAPTFPFEKIKIEWYNFSRITVLLSIDEVEFKLEYKLNEKTRKWARIVDQNTIDIFISKVYNQKISDNEIEKKSFMDKRITIPSLNRFVFCSNDRIISNDSKDSDVIDSHRDWKAKWVLFDYILGTNFQADSESTVQSMQNVYKFLKNEYSIQELNKGIEKNKWDKKDFWLFSPIQEEKIQEIHIKQVLFQDSDIALIDLKYALDKLSELLTDVWDKKEYSDLRTVIEEEYRNLSTFKEECQNRYTSMALELKTTIQEYSDWIDTTYSQETRDIKEIEKLEKENNLLEKYHEAYLEIISPNREKFLLFFYTFLRTFNYQNCIVDLDTLKLNISNIEDYSEATLKICRICFLLSLLLYKKENSIAKNLWIWFFDWLLDGVWYDKIQNLINELVEKNVQIFLFIPKLISDANKDDFLDFLSQNQKVKLFPVERGDKIFTVIDNDNEVK